MPPESIIVEPSATIFNVTMILTGLLVIAGALLLFGAAWGRGVASLVGLFGVGVLGVVALLDLALYFALGPGSFFAVLGIGGPEEVGGVPDRPLDHRVRGASDGGGAFGLIYGF